MTASPAPGGARILPVASGVAWRTTKNIVSNPSLLLPSLAFPLMFFVAFAGGLTQLEDVPGFDYPPGYTTFQYAFVLLQSAAFGGVFTGFGVARDFESGFSKRLFLAAPRRAGIVIGYGLAAFVRWLIVAALLTVVALVFGMEIGGSPAEVLAVYLLALGVNAAGFLFACGVAMRFRTIQAGPLMQLPVFLALFFAPVYVPLDLLQGWIEVVASVNPITLLLETVRGLLAGDPAHLLGAFAVALALVVVLGLWARGGLRSAETAG